VKTINGFGPLSIVDKIVPLGNEVVDGTTRVSLAKGCTTVHAASSLDLAFHIRVMQIVFHGRIQLPPIHDAFQGSAVRFRVALVVQETTELLDTLITTISPLYSEIMKRTNMYVSKKGRQNDYVKVLEWKCWQITWIKY
jgi:hypothetical protein